MYQAHPFECHVCPRYSSGAIIPCCSSPQYNTPSSQSLKYNRWFKQSQTLTVQISYPSSSIVHPTIVYISTPFTFYRSRRLPSSVHSPVKSRSNFSDQTSLEPVHWKYSDRIPMYVMLISVYFATACRSARVRVPFMWTFDELKCIELKMLEFCLVSEKLMQNCMSICYKLEFNEF